MARRLNPGSSPLLGTLVGAALAVAASQLRTKLHDGEMGPRLVTEPGVGYRLVDPAAQPTA